MYVHVHVHVHVHVFLFADGRELTRPTRSVETPLFKANFSFFFSF
jgi:hypothetical protein